MTAMTPYAAAKIVNDTLKDAGIEKVLPPQMMYTYAKKGYIDTVTVNEKVRITQSGLDKWLAGYLGKLQGTTAEETDTNIDEDQLGLFDLEETVA